MRRTQSCFLCGDFRKEGGIIAQLDQFQVVSDLAPLAPGHVLIAPKVHYYSFSSLEAETLSHLNQITQLVRNILIDVYRGKVVFFEHGMGGSCDLPACGVEHAHLHAISLPTEDLVFGQKLIEFFDNFYLKEKLYYVNIKDYQDIKAVKGTSYLFTEDVDGSKRIIFTSSQFPSQILRRYIAKYLGSPFEYNWQLFVDKDKARKTTFFLRSRFANFGSS